MLPMTIPLKVKRVITSGKHNIMNDGDTGHAYSESPLLPHTKGDIQ